MLELAGIRIFARDTIGPEAPAVLQLALLHLGPGGHRRCHPSGQKPPHRTP